MLFCGTLCRVMWIIYILPCHRNVGVCVHDVSGASLGTPPLTQGVGGKGGGCRCGGSRFLFAEIEERGGEGRGGCFGGTDGGGRGPAAHQIIRGATRDLQPPQGKGVRPGPGPGRGPQLGGIKGHSRRAGEGGLQCAVSRQRTARGTSVHGRLHSGAAQ